MRQHVTRSAGAALVSAIFLIVMLAALGLSMASLSNVEHDTAAKSMLSAKVYYGAKAGLEWGVQRVVSDPAPPARCNGFSSGTTPFTPTGAGFTDVSVIVTCVQSSQHGAGTTSFTYHILSEASTGALGSLNYAQRRMEASVSNIP